MHRRRHGRGHDHRARVTGSTLARVLALAGSAIACGDSASRDVSERAPIAIPARGPAALYPRRISLAGSLGTRRADALVAVPGTDWIAVQQGADIAVVDVSAASVRWEGSCRGAIAFASPAELICAGSAHVTGLSASDGRVAWSRLGQFRAGRGERVAFEHDGRLWIRDLATRTAQSWTSATSDVPIHALCRDRLLAWDPRGAIALLRLGRDRVEPVWSRMVAAPVHRIGPCDDAVTVVETGGQLLALDNDTGQDVSSAVAVRSWWPSRVGEGIETCTQRGVQRRTARLEVERVIDSRCWGGGVVAASEDVRVLRGPSETLVVIDAQGPRAWLGAPAAIGAIAATPTRILTDSLGIYEIPPRDPDAAPPIPLPPPRRARQIQLRPVPLGEPSDATAIELAASSRGAIHVAASDGYLAVASGRSLWLVDLARRQIAWVANPACARPVDVAVSGGVVLCAGIDRVAAWSVDGRAIWTGQPADSIAARDRRAVITRGRVAEVIDVQSGRTLSRAEPDAMLALLSEGELASARRGIVSAHAWSVRFGPPIAALGASQSSVRVALANGELWTLSASDGSGVALGGWSTAWVASSGSDRVLETLDGAPGETVVIAYDLDGSERFRRALPLGESASIAPAGGAHTPVVAFLGSRAVLLTPDAGELVGHFRSPGELVAAASTHVDGAPVTVGVTREPLAVVIFQ